MEDDDFIDSLVDEADADNGSYDSLQFTHAYVSIRITDLLHGVQEGMRNPTVAPYSIFGFEPCVSGVQAFVGATPEGVLLWMKQEDLALAPLISREMKVPVHWISVYEMFRCRAYVRFEDGRCAQEVLDPERYWRSNILDGEDLVGGGNRRFHAYEDFSEFLKPVYSPVDTELDFTVLLDMIEHEAACPALIHLAIRDGVVVASFVGEWGSAERDRILGCVSLENWSFRDYRRE